MIRAFVVLGLLISACGHRGIVDPAFQRGLAKFISYHGAAVAAPVDIHFGPTGIPGIVGYCEGGAITVDPDWWALATPTSQDSLIIHELGHCALGWEHDTLTIADGCPESVMYPSVLPDFCAFKYSDTIYTTYTRTAPGDSNIPK